MSLNITSFRCCEHWLTTILAYKLVCYTATVNLASFPYPVTTGCCNHFNNQRRYRYVGFMFRKTLAHIYRHYANYARIAIICQHVFSCSSLFVMSLALTVTCFLLLGFQRVDKLKHLLLLWQFFLLWWLVEPPSWQSMHGVAATSWRSLNRSWPKSHQKITS